MASGSLIGVLAIFTIGAALVGSIVYFGFFLNNPRNRDAAQNVVRGGKSASTKVAEDATEGTYHDRTLKERLDDSAASHHPYDPDPAKRGVS